MSKKKDAFPLTAALAHRERELRQEVFMRERIRKTLSKLLAEYTQARGARKDLLETAYGDLMTKAFSPSNYPTIQEACGQVPIQEIHND